MSEQQKLNTATPESKTERISANPEKGGRPKKTAVKLTEQELLAPQIQRKTFVEVYQRPMTKEEGIRYFTYKFQVLGSIVHNWVAEARYCGVNEHTIIDWRKTVFKMVEYDSTALRAELDDKLRQAIDRCTEVMNTPIPDDAPANIKNAMRAQHINASRTLAYLTKTATEFTEKWGIKHKDMRPAPVPVAEQSAAEGELIDSLADEVLAGYNAKILAKSKKPEGV